MSNKIEIMPWVYDFTLLNNPIFYFKSKLLSKFNTIILMCIILSFSSDIRLICLFFSNYVSSSFMLKFPWVFLSSILPKESVLSEPSSSSSFLLFLFSFPKVFESLLYFWYKIWWLTRTCSSSSSNNANEGNWY